MLNQTLRCRTLLFAILTIGFVLTINNVFYPNLAHSKLFIEPTNRSSLYPQLSSNVIVPGSERIVASNLIGSHKLSSSTPTLYSTSSTQSISMSASHPITRTAQNSNSNNKVIMIGFDDGWKSQIQYAKPILDKYGFKASFFIVCNYANSGDPTRLNWQDIAVLQHDHMDIESHTMDHKPLDKMSKSHLTYEIGGSKQCLATHGINSTIFAYPFNLGSNKPSVVDKVSRYYDFARTGTYPLMFLNCNGFVNIKSQQTDCRTHLPNGKLTFANRYDIRSDSFFHVSSGHNYSPAEMFQRFIQQVNSQIPYNNNGKINAIPIITYHQLTYNMQEYSNAATTITVPLFDQEMKYLHDNGFKVLLLNQFGFDPINNIFYLKNMKTRSGTN
jgi:peptidoglycan/xylan/chitin deacetylase (PgdA/CDA1 family)